VWSCLVLMASSGEFRDVGSGREGHWREIA